MAIYFGNNTLSLNDEQYSAVTHPPDVPLQILAGPGSGKTKVLTTRVAYLVQEKSIPPSQICAVTFTNKAANEMKERLKKLIGPKHTDELVMGTFHALCAKFLRKFGYYISLPRNFTICDAEESKKIIHNILKAYESELSSSAMTFEAGHVLASISKAKSKGHSPDDIRRASRSDDKIQMMIAQFYQDYVAALKESNSLDFDDLLLYGVKLFTKERMTVSWCRHLLVDEFQDTNSMQYELMVRLASAHGCVTIVGDPDQSIYGWRSAEVTNLARMRNDFSGTRQIFLEENYRSTGSIIAACLAIVSQDKSRIAKSLRTSHAAGARPTLQAFSSEQKEADFIAFEIKRLIAHSGEMLGWNDFVVLLRYNALSRATETAFQKEGIPNRVLAGQKFFDRLEIKDVLAYLQLIDNPSYTPAFIRAAHTPPRGLGEKALSELTSRAKRMKISPMELAEGIYSGAKPDSRPAVKRRLEGLVKPVVILRKLAEEGAPVTDLIQRLLLLINYEAHLKKSQKDWETRWENIQELINFASSAMAYSDAENANEQPSTNRRVAEEVVDVDLLNGSNEEEQGQGGSSETPLRAFLHASMLSTDVETDDNTGDAKVTISTCHSAKGLEWPIVFVPAVEQGTFPFYRAEDVEEERRLLYVACTRAQGLLYLSHSTQRMARGNIVDKDLSVFISRLPSTLFSPTPPTLTAKDRIETAKLLGRKAIKEEAVQEKIQEHNAANWARLQDGQSYSRPYSQPLANERHARNHPRRTSVSDASGSGVSSDARLRNQPPVSGSVSFETSTLQSARRGENTSDPGPTASSSGMGASAPPKPRFGVASQAHLPGHSLPLPSVPVPQTSLSSLQSTSNESLARMKSLGLPDSSTHPPPDQNNTRLATGKRRLGMGRPTAAGYPNKKRKD